MTLAVEPLADHELDAFDCGHGALSDWLRRHARQAARQGTRTYVLVDERTRAVVGYFAIAPYLVEREAMPRSIGRGAPRQIPAILLAKLALDRSAHGQGLGSELLVHALEIIVESARAAGGKLVVVDAIDGAARAFYERHDFQPVPDHPRRLVQRLSVIAATLGRPWP